MTDTSTKRIYYDNTYLDKLEARVVEIGQDENGSYIIFDKTIFHPQGGGQPNDEGYFKINGKQYPIIKLIAPRNPYQEPYLIKHYYEGERNFQKGEKVIQVIDMKKRLLFARYHSGGHLLSTAVNKLFPELEGYKGNHFPGQAFVIFKGSFADDFLSQKDKISNLVNQLVKDNLSVLVEWKEKVRTVSFGGFNKSYPCGGTHVKNTFEIGEIVLRNIKKDKDNKTNFKIGYDVADKQ